MDALSGEANLIVVVSLSLQLIQSFHAMNACRKRVKNASVELLRLAETLDYFEAILEDLQQLIERQRKFQQASDPIDRSLLVCLKSCEKGIGRLRRFIERYNRTQSQTLSFPTNLRLDIGFGLRLKGILDLERSIDLEINRLGAALVA